MQNTLVKIRSGNVSLQFKSAEWRGVQFSFCDMNVPLRDGNECWHPFPEHARREIEAPVINLADAGEMMWKEALKVSRRQSS